LVKMQVEDTIRRHVRSSSCVNSCMSSRTTWESLGAVGVRAVTSAFGVGRLVPDLLGSS
jgi:hypothetical protein